MPFVSSPAGRRVREAREGGDEPIWMDRVLVDAIHADLLESYGGLPGVRDENALEAALARPRNRFHYEPDADLFALGAAYAFALATSHAFSDGNKRSAFAVMSAFMVLNGYLVDVPEPDIVALMLDVATRRLSEDALAAWLRVHTIRVPEGDEP